MLIQVALDMIFTTGFGITTIAFPFLRHWWLYLVFGVWLVKPSLIYCWRVRGEPRIVWVAGCVEAFLSMAGVAAVSLVCFLAVDRWFPVFQSY